MIDRFFTLLISPMFQILESQYNRFLIRPNKWPMKIQLRVRNPWYQCEYNTYEMIRRTTSQLKVPLMDANGMLIDREEGDHAWLPHILNTWGFGDDIHSYFHLQGDKTLHTVGCVVSIIPVQTLQCSANRLTNKSNQINFFMSYSKT